MKSKFRKECLEKREKIKRQNLDLKVFGLEEYKNAKTVFIYLSTPFEIDTMGILHKALKEKTVLVPYCVDDKGNMIACKIDSLYDVKEGRFSILEPKKPIEYTKNIDFTLVPGVAFSKDGYRIGYGKGYYDRFLKTHKTFSVGLSYDELLFDKIPTDSFDVKLNMIITPTKEIKI